VAAARSTRQWLAWALGTGSLVLAPWVCAGAGYLGIGTGIVYAPDERFSATDVFLDYDLGFQVGQLTAGYAFDSGWRAELEAAYRRNELEIIEFADPRGTINTGLDDAVDAASLMANAIYEFEWRASLRPYLGIGLGMARVGYELSDDHSGEIILDQTKTAFAYQALAGVDVPLGRRWHLSADYRYWANARLHLRTESGDPIRTDHPVHQASMTLRYLFSDDRSIPARPAVAAARNWYSALRLGSVMAEDSDIDDGQIDTNFDGFDLGTMVSAAVGYIPTAAALRGWRAELEVARWRNSADIIDFGKRRGEFRLHGPVTVVGVMANLIYDFRPQSALRPFAGIGIGFADVDYDVTLEEDNTRTQYVHDSDSGFAAHALLGVNAQISERVAVGLHYRYWLSRSIDLEDPQQVPLKTEHSAHALLLDLRYHLGR